MELKIRLLLLFTATLTFCPNAFSLAHFIIQDSEQKKIVFIEDLERKQNLVLAIPCDKCERETIRIFDHLEKAKDLRFNKGILTPISSPSDLHQLHKRQENFKNCNNCQFFYDLGGRIAKPTVGKLQWLLLGPAGQSKLITADDHILLQNELKKMNVKR